MDRERTIRPSKRSLHHLQSPFCGAKAPSFAAEGILQDTQGVGLDRVGGRMHCDEARGWQSTLHAAVVLPDPAGEPRLLLLPEGDGWALPRAILPEQVWWPVCRWIIAATMEQLGVDAVVLS